MKKRILALVCAVVMTVGMSLTVSAAASGYASSTASSNSGTSSSVVSSEAAQVESIPAENLATATQQIDYATIQEFAKTTTIKSGVAGATVNPVMGVTVVEAIKEAKAQVGNNAFIASVIDIKADAPGTYTVACPNVWAGQKVFILHEISAGNWEKITPAKVANNEVTFTLNSYSTVAIVVDTTAGKTADVAPMVAMMAVVCLAGVAVCGKKRA